MSGRADNAQDTERERSRHYSPCYIICWKEDSRGETKFLRRGGVDINICRWMIREHRRRSLHGFHPLVNISVGEYHLSVWICFDKLISEQYGWIVLENLPEITIQRVPQILSCVLALTSKSPTSLSNSARP